MRFALCDAGLFWFLRAVSPHDYSHLLARWRELARRARLRTRLLARAGKYSLIYLQTPALAAHPPDSTEACGAYLSAGIHGDEPAGTEGLLAWAEANADRLRGWPLLIFPCLNPWGLARNVRTDEQGIDLNRNFHRDHPLIAGIRAVVGGRRFAACLHLHEDYDAEGAYLYELSRGASWGVDLLAAVARVLPIDPRPRIEGRKIVAGLFNRRIPPKKFEELGYPEAVWLHRGHTDRAYTFETPSEIALEKRIAGHVALLEALVRRALG